MTLSPEVLVAVVAATTGAIGILWRFVLEAYRDVRAQRDVAVVAWQSTVSAIERLSDAVEKLIETRK